MHGCIYIGINGFNWRLPLLPNWQHNSMICHNKYGLLSLWWTDSLILNMNPDENTKLEWKKNNNIIPTANRDLGLGQSLLLNNDESKLFVIGGADNTIFTYQKWFTMLDFEESNKKWRSLKDMNYCKYQCGSFYDGVNNKIYVGGGNGYTGTDYINSASQRREYYDMVKNEWYTLKNTKYKHERYPSVWIDDGDRNVLCIASISADCIEYLDLRMGDREGMIIKGEISENMKLVKGLFTANSIAKNGQEKSRLLR